MACNLLCSFWCGGWHGFLKGGDGMRIGGFGLSVLLFCLVVCDIQRGISHFALLGFCEGVMDDVVVQIGL